MRRVKGLGWKGVSKAQSGGIEVLSLLSSFTFAASDPFPVNPGSFMATFVLLAEGKKMLFFLQISLLIH